MQWLNRIVDELESRHPEGEVLVESGSAPSGPYHLGHLREFLTPDAIYLELKRRGRKARHIHFVDDLDALRKIPKSVPGSFEKYLGVPLCDVPAPDGSDISYADYFLRDVQEACKILGIEAEFVRSHEKYRSGFFESAIEQVIGRLDEARKAVEISSGRKLSAEWVPFQILENGRFENRKFLSLDTDSKTLHYEGKNGAENKVRYDNGGVKLDWRLDWPARWWLLHVSAEPFGRDHASAGGSYDTGVQAMKYVFKAEPPMPVPYDFINMSGETKKMSASKGTGLNVVETSLLMPPEAVRYFVFRSPASKRLSFDPVSGLVKLMDEFAALASKTDRSASEEQLIYLCTHGRNKPIASRVPFSHLVTSYQAALRDADRTLDTIKRTEYSDIAGQDAEIIRNELKFIDVWLEKRAPESVKFALKNTVSSDKFTKTQKQYFKALADKIAEAPQEADGEWFHKTIYDLKVSSDLAPKELFSSLYQLLIGKDAGPRAGWFLSILPRKWLVSRLRLEDAKEQDDADAAGVEVKVTASSVQLTNDTRFAIDKAILDHFPDTAIGYLVAELPTKLSLAEDPLDQAIETLADRGIEAGNLTAQTEIAVWRNAYKSFGVKPSDFLSSAEALAKRAVKNKLAHVNPIVDVYNAVSLKHLIPMGAFDLDKIHGDITLRYGKAGESVGLLGMERPVTVEPKHVVYADQQQIISWLWNHRDATATAVTDDTKHALFFADSLLGKELAVKAMQGLAADLAQLGITPTTCGVVAKTVK